MLPIRGKLFLMLQNVILTLLCAILKPIAPAILLTPSLIYHISTIYYAMPPS